MHIATTEEINNLEICVNNQFIKLLPEKFYYIKKDYSKNGSCSYYLLSKYPFSKIELESINDYSMLIIELSDEEKNLFDDMSGLLLERRELIKKIKLLALLKKISKMKIIAISDNGDSEEYIKKWMLDFKKQNKAPALSSEILYNYIYFKYGISYMFFPSKISLIVTNQCNAQCKTCYRAGSQNDIILNLEDWMSIVDNAIQNGCDRFKILGGEPFLFEYLDELISYILKSNATCEVSSNGIVFADKNVVKKISSKFSKEFMLQISLDGVGRKNDSQRNGAVALSVMSGMKNLKEAGIEFNVNCIVTSNNIDEIVPLVEFVSSMNSTIRFQSLKLLGAANNNAYLMLQENATLEVYNLIENLKKDYRNIINSLSLYPWQKGLTSGKPNTIRRCRAYRYSMAIAPDGKLLPCEFFESINNLNYNNIQNANLFEDWHMSPIAKSMRKSVLKGPCHDCFYGSVCEQGCSAEVFNMTGSFESSNPLCSIVNSANEFKNIS